MNKNADLSENEENLPWNKKGFAGEFLFLLIIPKNPPAILHLSRKYILHQFEIPVLPFESLGYRDLINLRKGFPAITHPPVLKLFGFAKFIGKGIDPEMIQKDVGPVLDIGAFVKLLFHVRMEKLPGSRKIAFLLVCIKLIHRADGPLFCGRQDEPDKEKEGCTGNENHDELNGEFAAFFHCGRPPLRQVIKRYSPVRKNITGQIYLVNILQL